MKVSKEGLTLTGARVAGLAASACSAGRGALPTRVEMNGQA